MSRSRLFLLAFCLAALFAMAMASLPRPPDIPWHPEDKIQHITAFVVLTALAIPAFPRARLIHILLGLAAFGALIEFVQSIPELHRDSDWYDWLTDVAAISVVIGVAQFLRGLRRIR